MKTNRSYRVKPHEKVRLSHVSSSYTGKYKSEKEAKADLEDHRAKLDALQELLTAEVKHAVLVVLQGMDTAGKDGTIRHIFTGVNPQGCDVTPFKVPTPLEARHDFLWRAHKAIPPRGKIGIFNRSHYEDVLVTRVHKLITEDEARTRMKEIVHFEQMLARNGVTILKFFLHISHEEQTRRLRERLDNTDKQWKMSPADFAERRYWPDYQKAYEDVLTHTSRKHAPWFIVPSDHKWYRNVFISGVMVQALRDLKMKYPKPSFDASKIRL
ncbi:MAG TPA: polyphosphate kinase 2 family protein [Acidobacteriaceae bacterium]|jgi:PPK2 family polyphosphate:nucleotide phosphotransferase|nr:polyphosphate kinase 2 family protein [Acidobacteriaceae bacterium]